MASPAALPLLPRGANALGLGLVATGLALGLARLVLGFRPPALELPVFAIWSFFFESRVFAPITKNLTLEMAALALLAGLACLAFARQPLEDALTEQLRARALFVALAANTALLALSLFTFFGLGFVYVLVGNLFSTLLIMSVAFHVFLARARSAGRQRC